MECDLYSVVSDINKESIEGLITGDVDVIHVKDFYPKDLTKEISYKLISDPRRGFFKKDNKISRVGMPHFDVVDSNSFHEYHKTAVDSISKLRETFYPYISPIDKLRLLLDEIWPAGAQLENLYGLKCFVGICRILESGVEIRPHTDKLLRDSPDSYQAQSMKGQIAANVFISSPHEGGELELWLDEPSEELYQKQIARTGLFSVHRDELGEPKLVLKPEEGDLILFNSYKYHAVRPGIGGNQINMGAFIGYRGLQAPLTFWS